MLGQFFDRLNLKAKNNETKLQEQETRLTTKVSAPKSTQPHQARIASLSPETTAHSNQYHFRQYSPTSTSRIGSAKPYEENKAFNPSNVVPKRYGEDQNAQYYTTNQTNMSRVLQPNKPDMQRDKPKNVPNFEFRPLDKESFATSSPNTSMKEGSIVVQSIRPSQMVSASKILFAGVRPLDTKAPENKPMTIGNRGHKSPKDTPMEKGQKANHHEMNNNHFETASQRRQHAWQEWWNEKKYNNQQLIEAARIGNLKLATQLLDKRKGDLMANVNGKADNDWTPLHFACLNGDLEFVNLLLLHEANIDAETTLKFTPIHVAAQRGQTEIVQLLANSGADINCRDLYNNTPLHYAVQNDHKRIVQLLLSRPSLDLSIRNNDNKLAVELANSVEVKKILEAFISEKNLLNSNFTNKVTIHNTKAENIQKMFESVMTNKNFQPPKHIERDENGAPKKPQTYGNTFTASGDTKCHSSLNSSDGEIPNNENNSEEEKIGPQSFIVHTMIGKGSFGEVYLVEKKNTNTYYAMKVLNKSRIAKHNLVRYVLTERNVLSITNHPFIVKLNYAFQTPDKLFLILDYCPGGDLGEYLQKERRFSEERARLYLAEITLALEDLHKRDIIFRDLKPDNIVLDANGHAMLTDFGLSKEGVLDQINGARSFCGSVAYLAPEMLKRVGHGKAVDWYLLGVVFYEMLVGVPPYYANNREELFANIEKAPLKIPSKISAEAKSLLIGLLQRNPAKRLGAGKGDAEEVKAHPFFAKLNWSDVEKKKLKVPVPDKRVNFAKMSINPFGGLAQESGDDNHITGWSFVAPRQQEPNS